MTAPAEFATARALITSVRALDGREPSELLVSQMATTAFALFVQLVEDVHKIASAPDPTVRVDGIGLVDN